MKFIKITLLFSLLLIAYNATAQKIGITGGNNISTIIYDPSINDNYPLVGIHLGLLFEKAVLYEGLYFQTGLIFSQKGSEFKGSYLGYDSKFNTSSGGYGGYGYYSVDVENDKIQKRLNYIDLPLVILYKYEIQEISILGKFGSSISKGLFGKERIDSDENSKIRFDGKDHSIFDIGLHFGIGFEWNQNMQFTVNYQLELTNIEVDAIQQRNRVLQLSGSYFFSKFSFI